MVVKASFEYGSSFNTIVIFVIFRSSDMKASKDFLKSSFVNASSGIKKVFAFSCVKYPFVCSSPSEMPFNPSFTSVNFSPNSPKPFSPSTSCC